MQRIYAEIFSLFYRLYEKRADFNPTLSAGAAVAAVQLICFVDLALLLNWTGLYATDLSKYKTVSAIAAAALGLLNYLLLRDGGAQRYLALADSPRRALYVLVGVAVGTAMMMSLYKGWLG